MNRTSTKRKRNSSSYRLILDYEQIVETLEDYNRDEVLSEMNDSKTYLLVEKVLTFADLPTCGKYTYAKKDKLKKDAFSEENIKRRTEDNYLFYATKEDICQYEMKNKKDKLFFCETKQSNMTLPLAFYEFLGLDGGARKNKGVSLNKGIYSSYIVNSCINGCFDEKVTNEVFSNLGRKKLAKSISLDYSQKFTPIDITIAVHGIGIVKNKVFSDLRGNVFAKDKLFVLAEKNQNGEYRIFYMFYRNPRFYYLNKMQMPSYLLPLYGCEENEKTTESRKGQAKWRNLLAEYALTTSVEDSNKIVCPFSNVEVTYPAEGTLLRASHIKAYADCKNRDGSINVDEAYDKENGFLVTANVDALFDKHMISVDGDGKVVVSKMISPSLVFEQLKINKVISPEFISEKKKEYLKIHYETFLKMENRKKE